MRDMSYIEKYREIEKFAKEFWQKNHVHESRIDFAREPETVFDFFPYPSGIGLHIGHTLGYIATDVYARYKRLLGKNVLFAMGFDSFGLPAEQFAIETGVHPEITTKQNIANMQKQLNILGLMHDPNRTFSTTDKDYYKWTQWIFLQLYNSYFDQVENKAKPISELEKKLLQDGLDGKQLYDALSLNRLAYLDDVEVNWCPKLGTVLSAEEVINGLSERGNHPVYKKKLRQWVLRITAYAQRLLEHLDDLDWPESVKEMQRNWIGVSSGHEIVFFEHIVELEPFSVAQIPEENQVKEVCDQKPLSLKVFTTRLEMLSGATFCAINIHHPDVLRFCKTSQVREFLEQNRNNENFVGSVFTGTYMYNPINDRKMPVYIADYVVDYGTRAVMGVPAHDDRDFKFQKQYGIEIIPVIVPDKEYLKVHDITAQEYKENIEQYDVFGKKSNELLLFNRRTVEQEIAELEKHPFVKRKINMKLRDWIFSRQRYWGEPFPIVLDENGCAYALEVDQLPVQLPELADFKNDCESDEIRKPLDKVTKWCDVNFVKLDISTARIVDAPAGSEIDIEGTKYLVCTGKRETNTMPNWAGSCWYYLRYMDPANADEFASLDAQKYWSGIEHNHNKLGMLDLYLGGAEHAVLHLLYARFWHMVLYDLNKVVTPEPFARLFNQGMILGAAYSDANGSYYAPNDVVKNGNEWSVKATGISVVQTIGKIGKRYKNGVPPEEITDEYGIDALRLYMMYLGPLEQSKPWDYSAIKGMVRFLEKIISVEIIDQDSANALYDFNETLKKVQQDCHELKFNTAIAAIIIFINEHRKMTKELYAKLITILAPFAVHTCEYIHAQLGGQGSIFDSQWPVIESIEKQIKSINVVFTVNGKKRCVEEYDPSVEQNILEARAREIVQDAKKIVVIKDNNGLPKLVNIVV